MSGPTKATAFRLEDTALEELDAIANAGDCTRTEAIKRLIRRERRRVSLQVATLDARIRAELGQAVDGSVRLLEDGTAGLEASDCTYFIDGHEDALCVSRTRGGRYEAGVVEGGEIRWIAVTGAGAPEAN